MLRAVNCTLQTGRIGQILSCLRYQLSSWNSNNVATTNGIHTLFKNEFRCLPHMKTGRKSRRKKIRFSRKRHRKNRTAGSSTSYATIPKSYSAKIFGALKSLDPASVMQAQQLMNQFVNTIFQRSAQDALSVNHLHPPTYYLFTVRLTHNQTIGRVAATNQPPYY
ncbi:hypothetical protein LOAG_10469 [Loa loa]|uniref:Uncharacterized protein n=1 Tax=Loa loa TaxID=7209 RepID=A0A1I7VIM1_LOALO|nr:hypothetical protein LOAG_10469 [Loa loa]EFO18027.2 hypothetical protein LOAG_10469 [Loa loa]